MLFRSILIAGLLERDIFYLYLPEFDKPWVTHLRENCRCPTNLCAWRPNKSTRIEACSRHQALFWRRCRGSEHLKVSSLDLAIKSFCFLFLFLLVWLMERCPLNFLFESDLSTTTMVDKVTPHTECIPFKIPMGKLILL